MSARWGEPQALRAPSVLEQSGNRGTVALVTVLLMLAAILGALL